MAPGAHLGARPGCAHVFLQVGRIAALGRKDNFQEMTWGGRVDTPFFSTAALSQFVPPPLPQASFKSLFKKMSGILSTDLPHHV